MTGEQIKKVMADLEVTQQQLADSLGVARNTVNRWANGLEIVPRIAELAIEAIQLKSMPPRREPKSKKVR